MGRHVRRTSRNRNAAPVQAMRRLPETRGFGEAPRGSSKLVLSGQDAINAPSVLAKPGFLGIDFGQIAGNIADFLGDSFVGLFEDTPPPRAPPGGGGGGGRPATGRDTVFGRGSATGGINPVIDQATGERLFDRNAPSALDNTSGGFDFGDEVGDILAELGLGGFAEPQQAAIAGTGSEFGGPVTGFFTDLDANQLADAAGRPLVVNPGLEERIKCPRGYVAVEIDEEGTRVCMLKGAAISQGLYSRRPRPPISASEWRILKSSGRTAKKVEVVLGKAGAAVGKKLISKSARASRPRPRHAALPPARQILLPPGSDDDTVIVT